jgi:DNA-binding GntR family transcriptional regulator
MRSAATQTSSDTLPRRIATRLARMIIAGRLGPGTRLHEIPLAKQFRVSRAPIREAINELERLGLVVKRSRRGAQVISLTSRDVKEIYEVKVMVEGQAARLAAERITPSKLSKLTGVLGEMRYLSQRGDRVRYTASSRRFHQLLIAASGNARLVEIYKAMSRQIWWLGTMILSKSDRYRTSVDEHAEILDALAARDSKRAQVVTEDHVRRGAENFVEHFILWQVRPDKPIPLRTVPTMTLEGRSGPRRGRLAQQKKRGS